jgi:Ca2+-binding RTX toxin-like protein
MPEYMNHVDVVDLVESSEIINLQLELTRAHELIIELFALYEGEVVVIEEEEEEEFNCDDISEFNQIIGTANADVLIGTEGRDMIFGDAGDDFIDGKGGNDCLYGDAGNDIIYGGDDKDIIFGNRGDDVLYGSFEQELYDNKFGDIIDGGRGLDICLDYESQFECEG